MLELGEDSDRMHRDIGQYAREAGLEPAVILERDRNGDAGFGYNARTAEFGDMLAMGVIDPTKVTRSALQNAASVSGLLLTTEAMVAEIPEKNAAPAPDMGGIGGMGGMGGMGF